jgi:hypothetical protein
MSQSFLVGTSSPVGSETISPSMPARTDQSAAGSMFSDLMSDLERGHDVSIRHSNSPFMRGLADLDERSGQIMAQIEAPLPPDASVATAIQDGGQRQLSFLHLQTAITLTQTTANGVKKGLTDILNQK